MPLHKLSAVSHQSSAKKSLKQNFSHHFLPTTYNLPTKAKTQASLTYYQSGVSSMMVLILVVLLIVVGWEIGQFAQTFTDSGTEIPENAIGNKCIGSNTTFDCYDQDEGVDFVDKSP